uniref:Uncharacterized protein n=1 Tax=Siphoviridae sp. ctGKi16 TaxID=2825410 RepID=A0A8S5Q4E3_9CAUD|nr:MAG TPA: hypothetical protein [Siphoviridae sp. ctGKi16]
MTIVYYYLRGNFFENAVNLQSGHCEHRRTWGYLDQMKIA